MAVRAGTSDALLLGRQVILHLCPFRVRRSVGLIGVYRNGIALGIVNPASNLTR